jgi:hypothetical protein
MNTPRTVKKIIAGMLLSGGVAVAGFGLAAGTAQADPGCTKHYACWCPGQALPGPAIIGDWDMTACHNWHFASQDTPPGPGGKVEQGQMPPPPNCPPFPIAFMCP